MRFGGTAVVFVVRGLLVGLAVAALPGCERDDGGSQAQSLDNFTAGATVRTNRCAKDGMTAEKALALSVIKAPLNERIKTDKDLPAARRDDLKGAAALALTAVPLKLQRLFERIGGDIRITPAAAKICEPFYAEQGGAQKPIAAADGAVAAVVQGCWVAAYADGRQESLSIVLADDEASIGHGMVRAFGYVLSQHIPRLDVVNGKLVRHDVINPQFAAHGRALAAALRQDLGRAGPSEAVVDDDRYGAFALAESFDSWQCSDDSRQAMHDGFKLTHDAFLALSHGLAADIKAALQRLTRVPRASLALTQDVVTTEPIIAGAGGGASDFSQPMVTGDGAAQPAGDDFFGGSTAPTGQEPSVGTAGGSDFGADPWLIAQDTVPAVPGTPTTTAPGTSTFFGDSTDGIAKGPSGTPNIVVTNDPTVTDVVINIGSNGEYQVTKPPTVGVSINSPQPTVDAGGLLSDGVLVPNVPTATNGQLIPPATSGQQAPAAVGAANPVGQAGSPFTAWTGFAGSFAPAFGGYGSSNGGYPQVAQALNNCN